MVSCEPSLAERSAMLCRLAWCWATAAWTENTSLTSVVYPNTLNLDPDPDAGFWPNLDSDPDPGLDKELCS